MSDIFDITGYCDVPSASGLVDTFGQEIVERALELAKGQSPYANLMPYINRALEEANARAVADRRV